MRAEEIAGTCAMVIDEFFLPSVNQLTGSLQSDFWCPTDPARVASGQWLPFERGTMVAVDGDPLVYVYYESGSWEQVPRAEGDAPEGIPQVPAPFAGVLAAEGRYMLLGEPLQEEPLQSETLIQPFGGGIALGNRSSAQILFMARSDLRF
jgi:hypothetical protein